MFFKLNRKYQDKRFAFLMEVKLPKRGRFRGPMRKNKPHSFVVNYFLKAADNQNIPVCTKFFRKLFGVGQRRLNTIAEGCKTGEGVVDKRGGDHKEPKYGEKRVKVYEFLSKLKACESHYSRNKSQRLYLPSNLNINKLFKMYNNSVTDNLKVKKTFFTKIFETKFNLGFGSPASDNCSFCHRTKTEIKTCENEREKQSLIAQFYVHKARAKAFHTLMKLNPYDSTTYIFDLQQVQPIPKLSIGEAFYSRQISFYSFCITDFAIKSPQLYVWNETQAGRGAQEISSALTDFLQKAAIDDNVTDIRLFADGCGGQNKNQHVVHALTYWLQKESPQFVKRITMHFPVRGHSYLPADRVFGQVEKKLRKVEEILDPGGYNEIYKEVANVRVLGKDWHIKNYKDLTKILKKIEGISDMKRIILEKVKKQNSIEVKIKFVPTYRFDDVSKTFSSMTKRGYQLNRDMTDRSNVPLASRIKDEKKR
jgi:hypothetical protein